MPIANTKRNLKVFELYKQGLTLSEIGDKLKLSKARVQQILFREVQEDIKKRLNIDYDLFPSEKESLKLAAKEEIDEMQRNRIQNQKIAILEKYRELKLTTKLLSVNQCAKLLDISPVSLKAQFPEITREIIEANRARWSRQYDKCRNCGTTTIKHASVGYCEVCFPKSQYFKDLQRKSFLKYADIRKIQNREYHKQYHQRPEVKEKLRQWNSEQNYDGNRQLALERDGFSCVRCGLTQEDNMGKYGRDLYVEHIKKQDGNDLSNLTTRCHACHYKTMREKNNLNI